MGSFIKNWLSQIHPSRITETQEIRWYKAINYLDNSEGESLINQVYNKKSVFKAAFSVIQEDWMINKMTNQFDGGQIPFLIDTLTGISIIAADAEKNMHLSLEINYSISKSLRIQDIGRCLFFAVSIENLSGKFCLAEITMFNSKKEVIGLGRQSVIISGDNKDFVEALGKSRPYLVKTIMVPKL